MKLCENKIALVTASTRGIGLASAQKLAENGAKVYLAARDKNKSQLIIDEIVAKGGQAEWVRFDSADPDTYTTCVEEVIKKEGRLDILVNNYGSTDVKVDFDIENTKFDDFIKIVNDNIASVYKTTQSAIKVMKDKGGMNIVNIASTGGLYADLSREAYGISKTAIIRLTKDTAIQGARYGIRANVVCPGCIATDAVKDNMTPEFTKTFLTTIPLNRLGEPEDIANAVLFYASDMSSYVTGGVMEVSGGSGMGTPMYPLYFMMQNRG